MDFTARKQRLCLRTSRFEFANGLSGCAFASSRAMREIKRRILRKLVARIQSNRWAFLLS
jgi:hypothetical protein